MPLSTIIKGKLSAVTPLGWLTQIMIFGKRMLSDHTWTLIIIQVEEYFIPAYTRTVTLSSQGLTSASEK